METQPLILQTAEIETLAEEQKNYFSIPICS